MRKILGLSSILLVFSLLLGACAAPSQQGTGATQAPEIGTEVVSTLPAETQAPAATVETTVEPQATTASTEAATSIAATPAATTAATEPAVTASPEMTTTAVLPATGIEDISRLSNWIDQTVYDSNNQSVGKVNQVAIDLATAKIVYVLVSKGEEVDKSPVVIPIDWRAFKLENGKPLVITVPASDVDAAPTLQLRAVPAMIPSDWGDEFGAYWTEKLNIPEATPAADQSASTPAPTETAKPSREGIILSGDFVGKAINASNNTEIGSVEDAVINIDTGEVTYLLVKAGESLGLGTKLIPVPVGALLQDVANHTFSLSIDPSVLKKAPNFDLSSIPGMNNSDWDAALLKFWNQFLKTK